MIDIAIPGYRTPPADGARVRLQRDAGHRRRCWRPASANACRASPAELRIHVVTGDTFGTARAELAGLPCAIVVLAAEGQAEAKARFARELGTPKVIAIGNGRNDRLLLEAAALAIGVCGREGIATEALQASDIVVPDPAAALDLLLDTKRLVATLRS